MERHKRGLAYRWDSPDQQVTIMLSHDNLGCGLSFYREGGHNYWYFPLIEWGKARSIGEALAEAYHCVSTGEEDG